MKHEFGKRKKKEVGVLWIDGGSTPKAEVAPDAGADLEAGGDRDGGFVFEGVFTDVAAGEARVGVVGGVKDGASGGIAGHG